MQAAKDLSGSGDDGDGDDDGEDDNGTPTLPPPVLPRKGQRFRIADPIELTEGASSIADLFERFNEVMVHRASPDADSASRIADLLERFADVEVYRTDDKDTRAEELIAQIREAGKQTASPHLSVDDLAEALKRAMDGMELETADAIIVDNGDLGEQLMQSAERRVIARIKDDPYLVLPRAA